MKRFCVLIVLVISQVYITVKIHQIVPFELMWFTFKFTLRIYLKCTVLSSDNAHNVAITTNKNVEQFHQPQNFPMPYYKSFAGSSLMV